MTPISKEVPSPVPAKLAVDRLGVVATTATVTATPPVADVPPVDEARRPASPELEKAVQALNDRYSKLRTDLRFTIDKDSGETVVAVVDSEDGTVLRQIPSEEVLRIASTLEQHRGALLRHTA